MKLSVRWEYIWKHEMAVPVRPLPALQLTQTTLLGLASKKVNMCSQT